MRPAPVTFETTGDADDRLAEKQTEVRRGDWQDPDAGAVNFEEYALRWVKERGLSPTTDELYRRLLRLHILPTFRAWDLDEITPPRIRTWRAERLDTVGETTVAKSYRLVKATLETAVEDELIRRNPCRIRGAGKESAGERPIATVEQVDALADAMGPRWRLMVYIAAYGPARPEEQAEMRRPDVDLETVGVWVRRAAPELTTGRRVVGCSSSGRRAPRFGGRRSGGSGGRLGPRSGFRRTSGSTIFVTPGTLSRPSRARRSRTRWCAPGSRPRGPR